MTVPNIQWIISRNSFSQKSRHCAYIIYRVKTCFLPANFIIFSTSCCLSLTPARLCKQLQIYDIDKSVAHIKKNLIDPVYNGSKCVFCLPWCCWFQPWRNQQVETLVSINTKAYKHSIYSSIFQLSIINNEKVKKKVKSFFYGILCGIVWKFTFLFKEHILFYY